MVVSVQAFGGTSTKLATEKGERFRERIGSTKRT